MSSSIVKIVIKKYGNPDFTGSSIILTNVNTALTSLLLRKDITLNIELE